MPYYQIGQVITGETKTLLWQKYLTRPPREIIITDRVLKKEAHFKTKDGRTEGIARFFGDALDIESIVIQQIDKVTYKSVPHQDPIKYTNKRILNSQ